MKGTCNKKSYKKYLNEIIKITFSDVKIRLSLIVSLIFLIIGVIGNICAPLLLKRIIESFSLNSHIPIALILMSYGVVWMISQVSNNIRAFFTHKIELRIASVLGMKVLSHLYGLSHSFFLNQKPGALTNIIRRSQRDVPSLVLGLLFFVFPTLIEFISVIIFISILYPVIYSLLMGAVLVAYFLCNSISMKGILKDRDKANEVDKDVDGIVTDWISNYEAIKVFQQRELAVQTCERELANREFAETRFLKKYCISHAGLSAVLGIGLSLITYLVGQDVMKGILTVGDFALFNGYLLQFIIPIGILGQITQDIRKGLLDMKGVVDLLSIQSDIQEAVHPIHIRQSSLSVAFENVSFSYKDEDILTNVSFKVEAGQNAIIVGKSGAGKSTIAKLLLRLYDPRYGKVKLNGINLKSFSLSSLYQFISWVPQESYLLNDTLLANIQFVRPEATPKEIKEALDFAYLLNTIEKLPEGLNTIVGDRGLKLSGGEKQRISLARLFLRKPSICILDESTSCLDEETDMIIQENIEMFFKSATKIIITHRPNLMRKVDQIISIDEGFPSSNLKETVTIRP